MTHKQRQRLAYALASLESYVNQGQDFADALYKAWKVHNLNDKEFDLLRQVYDYNRGN